MGCALLGVGIWVRVDENFRQYVESSDSFSSFYTGAYMLIVTGVIVMVIGFLGCCGSIRESQCMLGTFFVCLFIVFVALIGIGIWAIVAKGSLKEQVSETLNKAVKAYPENKNFMDSIQTNLKCCGADMGITDYGITANSCLLRYAGKPCTDKLFEVFSSNLIIVAGVAIGIGVVTLLGMIFSMMLCCAIREATV
ncbi:CD9 antigen [Lamellibrachia satsuma]|nr:CD9 antigen [Lamellibrachia satsuma]